MSEIVNSNIGEIQPLPANLQFLREANTTGIIDWFYDNYYSWDEPALGMFPTVWHLLEKRIREHPNEAREVNGAGELPIHRVLGVSKPNATAPLSLVQLLIEIHPDGLHVQDDIGYIPLHYVVYISCIDCFRAILYNGHVEAATMQEEDGWTPLHISTMPDVGLANTWDLLRYNRECVNIQDSVGRTALDMLVEGINNNQRTSQQETTRQNAKLVLLKLVTNYNHVPKVPSDEIIRMVESSPACTVLAPRLEPGNDAFIVHQALAAKCPVVLVQALVQIFPNQVQQEYAIVRLPLHIALQHGLGASVRLLVDAYPAAMYIADPDTGRLPIEQAILNVANDGSIENVDAVDTLLQANPAFLERIV